MRHAGLLHSSSSLRWWDAGADIAVRPLALWNHWAIQMQVLFSLSLQVLLLLLAGTRRREASVPKFFLWLAYQLADSTALYALGHLSVSTVLGERPLVAFWAPFLVLHLGSPDNISAYALQDDQLWLRHLQTFIVHVVGAAYVIYKRIAVNNSPLLMPGILIFAVGVVKYAERIWALKCSNISSIQSSLDKGPPVRQHHHFHPDLKSKGKAAEQDEIYVRRAHSLFHICKRGMVDSWLQTESNGHWVQKDRERQNISELEALRKEQYKGMWTLIEMELSLMYDLLYTKAGVVHTWSGYCIRFTTPFATGASLLLFQFSDKDEHSRVDIAITYTLLAGAFVLETAYLLSALGSTWTYAFLCATRWSWIQYVALCTGRWHRFRQIFKVMTGRSRSKRSARRWSGKLGQYNMLHYCSRHYKAYIPFLGKLAELRILGIKDWWVRYHYSGATEVSDDLKQWLFSYIKKERLFNEKKYRVWTKWGQTLKAVDPELYKDLKILFQLEFQEGIIIWHIGTDVFLATRRRNGEDDAADVEDLVKGIRTMSNYMMFLLVERPYMLPGLAPSMLYREICEELTKRWDMENDPFQRKGNIFIMLKELFSLHDDPRLFAGRKGRSDYLADILYREYNFRGRVPHLYFAGKVAIKLLQREHEKGTQVVLPLLRDIWMDFLMYAANACSKEFHAKKLCNGGELTTILWLMAYYLNDEVLIVDYKDKDIK